MFQKHKPPDLPYGSLTNLTQTEGESPPDPRYGAFTYLTLTWTQGKPPGPPVRYLNLPNPNLNPRP